MALMSTDLLYAGEGPRFGDICAAAPSLRWLQSAAAGLDVPLYRPLLKPGVRITASHENTISIAEYVLGAVLRAYQQPERFADAQRRHAWEHHEFEELMGTTWIVVGFGAIGRAVAQRARAFGARVIGVRRSAGTEPGADELIAPDALIARIGEADVVVLARPGDPQGRAVLDAEVLAAMKPGSTLVNVARGSLIDVDALLRGLSRSQPATAILDAFDPEPLEADSPLWDHPGVIISPHASAGGLGRHERIARLFITNLSRLVAGEPLPDEIALEDLPVVGRPPAQFQASR
jgi:phosphoglycerate dehydrogenase-like enzyme